MKDSLLIITNSRFGFVESSSTRQRSRSNRHALPGISTQGQMRRLFASPGMDNCRPYASDDPHLSMSSASASQSVYRIRKIFSLFSREQICTAYKVASCISLPVSLTYQTLAKLKRLSRVSWDSSSNLLLSMLPQQANLNTLGYEISAL